MQEPVKVGDFVVLTTGNYIKDFTYCARISYSPDYVGLTGSVLSQTSEEVAETSPGGYPLKRTIQYTEMLAKHSTGFGHTFVLIVLTKDLIKLKGV